MINSKSDLTGKVVASRLRASHCDRWKAVGHAEQCNGHFVTRDGSFRSVEDLELATAIWVHWFDAHRLHSMIGNIPPTEYEDAYYAHQPA